MSLLSSVCPSAAEPWLLHSHQTGQGWPPPLGAIWDSRLLRSRAKQEGTRQGRKSGSAQNHLSRWQGAGGVPGLCDVQLSSRAGDGTQPWEEAPWAARERLEVTWAPE